MDEPIEVAGCAVSFVSPNPTEEEIQVARFWNHAAFPDLPSLVLVKEKT